VNCARHIRTQECEASSALATEFQLSAVIVAALRATHQVVSNCVTFSSQYVMPIPRYIVVALVRCLCACSRLPVRR
jgi:hypothetical protein